MFHSLLPGGSQEHRRFHKTFRRYLSDRIHSPKLHCSPGRPHATLKPPTLTQEPEHFTLEMKRQKVTSLEAFRVFAFLSSHYHAVPPSGFVLPLENTAKIVVPSTLPTAFLLPLLTSLRAAQYPAP